MIGNLFTLAFLLILSPFSQAASLQPGQKVPPISVRALDAEKACHVKDPGFWKTMKCNVVRPTNYLGNGDISHMYHHSSSSVVGDYIFFPLSKMTSGSVSDAVQSASNAKEFIENYLGSGFSCAAEDYVLHHDAQDWLQRLIRESLETKKQARLSDCQTVCIAKCMTSRLIYADQRGAFNRYGSPYDIADRGVGMCTEFSSLGKFLINSLGIPAENVAGQGHEFVRVKIKGTEYNVENEFVNCDFFPLN